MISRQYAGTNALKGDYTRTGERNLSGLVKDGVNSASRYYLNHIRDTYRQAVCRIRNITFSNPDPTLPVIPNPTFLVIPDPGPDPDLDLGLDQVQFLT